MSQQAIPLSEIQDLAANYSDRQGLRVIPMALAVIAQAFPLPARLLGVDSMLVCLAVGIGGYFLVGRYYRRRFGTVEELPYEGMSFLAQILLAMVLLPIAFVIDVLGHPPVFVSGLAIAAWLFATAWPARRIRGDYLSLGWVLALFALSPLVGMSMTETARAYGTWFGAMLLVAGIRDHLAFSRVFRKAAVA
jgi:hypothetical protein